MIEKLEILINRPFAHRGLHSNDKIAPENSVRAFQKAIDSNFAIELDVHILSDGEVVVFHDETLNRLCGVNRKIGDLTSGEVKDLLLLNSDNKIPFLREVLEIVDCRVPILIELKNRSRVGRLEGAVFNVLSGYAGEFAIQSFNPFSIGWFAKHAPAILRGQLSSSFRNEKMNPVKRYLLSQMHLNFISKPHFIAYDSLDIPNKRIMRIRRRGLPILCWTVRSSEELRRIRPFCENIIFEGFIPD